MSDYDEHAKPSPASLRYERVKRRAKFAAGKVEPRYRKVFIDRDIAKKPPQGRSEKSRSAWRNDPRRDEKIFRNINALLRSKQPVRVTNVSGHSVSAARKKLREADHSDERIIPDIGLPHWDHSSELLKMLGWGLASWDMNARPFTLRLSNDVIAAARADRRGMGRYLQDRISRHLRHRFPDTDHAFWFSVEQGVWDQPHLHGAVVVPPEGDEAVKAAFIAAGGKWSSKSRQFHFSRRGNLLTWVGYATKWLYGSKAKLRDEKLTGASSTLRRQAKRLYQAARKDWQKLYP